MTAPPPVVDLRDITVRYGPVVADDRVSLTVAAGEIHAVVGENGAGKSTLMKAALGLAPLASGEVWLAGERVLRPSPAEAIRRGVGMVHQHFMLVDTFSVVENVVLGAEPVGRWPWPKAIARGRAAAELAELGARYRLEVHPERLVRELSVGEQQRVEILKVLYQLRRRSTVGDAAARALILDEPTAVLTPLEVRDLFEVLRGLAAAGTAIVLVTHKLDEVMAISSRVTVLRRGRVVASLGTGSTSPSEIARAMVGRDPAPLPARKAAAPGEVLLALEDVHATAVTGGSAIRGVTLRVRAGEIVGVAGVEGNGQTALVEAACGLTRPTAGTVHQLGRDVTRASVAERRRLGLAHVPEDRHRRALLLDSSVAENLCLGREHVYRRALGFLDRGRLARDARTLLARHDVRPLDATLPARALSGGNQQKLVLARELATAPRILVAAQPTRGVDLGAIERIHGELLALRDASCGVLLVSAELDELLALADRIVVLLRGRVVAEVARADADRERLGRLMLGAHAAGEAA